MVQSESSDDRVPPARGDRFHTEQSARQPARDAAPPASFGEPETGAPRRDPLTDRPVSRAVSADPEGEGGSATRGEPLEPVAAPTHAEYVREGSRRGAGPASEGPEREVVRRIFDEGTGDEWLVVERDARRIPGTRGPRCLFFDGEGIVRRVWHYPPDWQTLPAAALLALMDRPPLGDL
jgi:hypothetical protein